MIDNWHEEYQQFDVAIENGRLILSQSATETKASFEDQLGGLSKKWTDMVEKIEHGKLEAEKVARKWWDISKSKTRMLKWMEKKENDLNQGEMNGGDLENAVNTEKKLKVFSADLVKSFGFFPSSLCYLKVVVFISLF